MSTIEYDYEPIPGLPGELPPGERLLWRGSPAWWPLARRALRVLPIAAYFLALALWQSGEAIAAHAPAGRVLHTALIPLALGVSVCGLLSLIGWAAARATVYTITNCRVVIRHGIALPMSLNLPFKQITSAGLCLHRDGSGDIALTLPKAQRVGYLLTWPHVRPGHYVQPQPSLRGLADASRAAEVLAAALKDSAHAPPDLSTAPADLSNAPPSGLAARTSVAA